MPRLTFSPVSFADLKRTQGLLKKAVPSLREFIFHNAEKRRRSLTLPVATVAGSAGKTSVKEILGSILNAHTARTTRRTHISVANQNTKLALGLQILRLPEETAFAVFEVGARRVGDFAIPLSYLQPSVVTLLNIGSAHAGEFGSLENLVREKLSILDASSAHTLIVPQEDPRILEYARDKNKGLQTFGFSEKSDIQVLGETSEEVRLRWHGRADRVFCPFIGPKKGLNVAAAVATAEALGIPREDIVSGLKNFHGVERRFQRFSWKGRIAIDDAFNASPESMREGLLYLSELAQNKKIILVLGSMLELGPYSEQEHRALGIFVDETFRGFKDLQLVTVGEEARAIAAAVTSSADSSRAVFTTAHYQEAKTVLEKIAPQAEILYFKASKGLQLQRIFQSDE